MSGSARLRELLAAATADLSSGDEDERFFNVMQASEAEEQLHALSRELASIVIDLLDDVATCTNAFWPYGSYPECTPEAPCDACQLRARVEALL